ncbi:MAG: IgGFc-binding protein [Polyangiaceae bacterium]|nr:IgGFc-binding protein [Polyangiaceae bacterium]
MTWAYLVLAASVSAPFAIAAGCSANASRFGDDPGTGGSGALGGGGSTHTGTGGSIGFGGNWNFDGGTCDYQCSSDFHAVLDCNGVVVQQCSGTQGCDLSSLSCADACTAAANNKQSVGCQYYATDMESYSSSYCFAAFVANTWNTPVHITVERNGASLPIANFARRPQGGGASITYDAYDPAAGLAPGEVAILFLSGNQGGAPDCPVPTAQGGDAAIGGTGIGSSFHIQTDVPVVAYQINPYGGGSVAVTGASLLLPTSAWDTNYVAVDAYRDDITGPSMNIIAAEDNTTVTMVPVAPVQGGAGIPGSAANTPFSFTLQKGQFGQLSQIAELTGSIIQADKPIGFMAGHPCMRAPYGVAYCDHGEQMVPPIQALGSEYVGVMYRPRAGEPAIWRLIGAVDGTQLTWSTPVGGPATLNRGQVVELQTGTPFAVHSQDDDHPFLLFTYMSGSTWGSLSDTNGLGDADFVISVPPAQYMTDYVFFTDPTYPETNLVVVRKKVNDAFAEVNLDCAGNLAGWQAVGDYEWTRADLVTGNFQGVGSCTNGRHLMTSDNPFGLWVWGWGTPFTTNFTANVSYGYPGGMNVQPINTVVIPPVPH